MGRQEKASIYMTLNLTNLDSSKPIRVVVVEDDVATRNMLVDILNRTPGYSVVAHFGEGTNAINSLPSTTPDLMLVDLGLPDISGLKVIEAASKANPECDVLVITTFGDESSVFSAIKAGADGYLLKGATSDELRRDINVLRSGGSPLSPEVARKLLKEFGANGHSERDVVEPKSKRTLTLKEVDILKFISKGFSYDETAAHFQITRDTVHAHLKNIYRKLSVHSKMQAVYEARRKKIIQ